MHGTETAGTVNYICKESRVCPCRVRILSLGTARCQVCADTNLRIRISRPGRTPGTDPRIRGPEDAWPKARASYAYVDTAAQRLASADPAGSSSQISHDPTRTAEASRRLSGRVCPV
jgi:hypothetical protein